MTGTAAIEKHVRNALTHSGYKSSVLTPEQHERALAAPQEKPELRGKALAGWIMDGTSLSEQHSAAEERDRAREIEKAREAEKGSGPLTVGEGKRLRDCEKRIERGMTTFIDVGAALMEVRNSRLYRESFATFEDYCQERWQLSKPHASRLIVGAEVAQAMVPTGTAPANERVARALAPLRDQPDVMQQAWREVLDRNGEQPTESVVREVVEKYKPSKPAHELVQEATNGHREEPDPASLPAMDQVMRAWHAITTAADEAMDLDRQTRKDFTLTAAQIQQLDEARGNARRAISAA